MKQFIFIILYGISVQAQKSILIKNAFIHDGKGNAPFKASVLIKNNIIEKIETNEINEQADTTIDAKNEHLYPGLISCNNILGIIEAEAIRPTADFWDIGEFNPHLRTLTSYNTDSKILPTVITNGILYTQCTPRGGYIAGRSCIVSTGAWNWEDAALKTEDGVHLYFPSSYFKKGWWAEQEGMEKNKEFSAQLQKIKAFLSDAKAYYLQHNTQEFNPRFEAMIDVFNGTQILYVHTDKAKDILIAIQTMQEFQIKNVVLVGCKESYKVVDIIKKSGFPIILGRMTDLPDDADSPVNIVYETPAILKKNGILFTVSMQGDMEAMHTRNLPFTSGICAAYGLSKEEVLQLITNNAAKITGVDNKIGSIEKGKIASIVISKGDLLDVVSNNITTIILEGQFVSIKNFQNELYEKYLAKYHLKN